MATAQCVVFTDEVTGNPMAKIEVRLIFGWHHHQPAAGGFQQQQRVDDAMNGVTRTR
jgi:hypothetical protein